MKPQLLLVPSKPTQSFSVRHDVGPHFFNRWHYHPEVELVYIMKGYGTKFIGDSITSFNEGEIALIGSNLPHHWRCDETYFDQKEQKLVEAIAVFFKENFWGPTFLDLPENRALKNLLTQAKRGLLLDGETKAKVAEYIEKMSKANDSEKFILLLETLHTISLSEEFSCLSTPAFQASSNQSDTDRINNIHQYSIKNFNNKITLDEIASVANLGVNSFCRYFKSQTRKTYSQYLMELRIGHACKLLMEKQLSVNKICFECGFNNFSNFNRCFKKITCRSPLQYKKDFEKNYQA